MIEEENFPLQEDEIPEQDDQSLSDQNLADLEEQEQRNDELLVQRIEEENDNTADDYGDIDETIDEPSQGEEDLVEFTERELPDDVNYDPVGSDRPVTKNQLGDNPPGSEQKAFDSGNAGDMSSDQVKYPDKDSIENFRENLDKTSAEIKLDKDLKENG